MFYKKNGESKYQKTNVHKFPFNILFIFFNCTVNVKQKLNINFFFNNY